VSYQQIEVAVQSALTQVGKTLEEVREIATIDVKADEVNLLLWCEKNKLELRIISRSLVKKRPWVTTPSSWVEKNIGVVGVCEPVALLASHQGEIILEKTALNGVTVAIIDDSPVFYEQ
jgi:cobalt-precorrin 5A hydrolase